MDADRFDILIRTLTTGSSRRGLLPRLAAAAFSLGFAGRFPGVTSAKKGKKKLRFNQFGCVSVGHPCRGKDAVCCSGICAGQKPKKGKKDRSRCRAHDASTCGPGQHLTECGGTDDPCVTSAGNAGVCATTTGNAGYCFNAQPLESPACKRDFDCQGVLGPSAACFVCPLSGAPRCGRILSMPA